MALFKTEKPAKTVTLADIYPEAFEDGLIETNVEFDIYLANQRTFRKHWFRLARAKGLPSIFSGNTDGDDNAIAQELNAMVLTSEGFEPAFELAVKGCIGDARYPNENGGPQKASLSDLTAEEREADLRELFEEAPDLLPALLMLSITGAVEQKKKTEEIAKKSSAGSRAKRASRAKKSAD